MSRRPWAWLWIAWVACGMTLAAASAFAQDEKPKPAAHKPKPAAAKTEEKEKEKAAPAGNRPAAHVDVPPPQDPAVQAILESKPSTPAECCRAAKVLAELHRPDLAKTFLQKVLDAKPAAEQLADLAKEFGAAMFLDLASQPELCPPARQLAEAVTAANNRQLQDPKRLAGLLEKIHDPSEDVRTEAIAGLKDARGAGVAALVAVLADRAHQADHPPARAALVAMGSEAVGPMLAILDGDNAEMKVDAVKVLAGLGGREAALLLLAPYSAPGGDPRVRAAADAALVRLVGHAPTPQEATQLLLQEATIYLQQRQPIRGQLDGQVQVWQWDAAKHECLARSCAVEDASRALAARLARDALAISPASRSARLLYLTAMLDESAYRRGLDKAAAPENDPAARTAARSGAAGVNELLTYALKGHYVGAEIMAAAVLGRIGTAQDALRLGPGPAPLVRAAGDSDRRVRMAALEAIVRLQPDGPFPGSSQVLESLCFFAATSGARRALVAGPNVAPLQEMAEMLSALGYQTDTASTGRQAIRLALGSPDYEVAFVDTTIDDPVAELLVQQFRHDCRTASLRIGVLARSGSIAKAERIARQDPLAMAFSRPHTPEAVAWQMGQLVTLAPREFVGFDERQAQAARALGCLAVLAGGSGKLYDVYRAEDSVMAALHVPKQSAAAAAVLARLGTPRAQRALVESASRTGQSIDVRRAAVKAFRRNTDKFGVLLNRAEIRRQYDRYNQSAGQDLATQQVLGSILDCIEARTQPAAAAPAAKPAPAARAAKKEKL